MCPASGVVLFIGCGVGNTEKYTASTAQSRCVCLCGGVCMCVYMCTIHILLVQMTLISSGMN